MTSHLHGKKVVLDLDALQALCHECLVAINASQNRVEREEYDRRMPVGSHLPLPQSLESQAVSGDRYFVELSA